MESRKLIHFDRMAALTDDQAAFNIVIILHLSPQPKPEAVRDALSHLEARHPALRCRIDNSHGYRFVFDVSTPFPVKHTRVVELDTWPRFAEAALNTRVNAAEGPPARCLLLTEEATDRASLVFSFHHAILDDQSAVCFLGDFLHLLGGEHEADWEPSGLMPAISEQLPPALSGIRRLPAFTAFSYRMFRDEITCRLAMRYAASPAENDLSSLRVALNAAEPARPETIRSFEESFGLKHVMTVGYGLAEATVGVSMTKPGAEVHVDAAGFTSVGKPFPGIETRILGEDGAYTNAGQAGEVLVSSPANTSGYFHDPDSRSQLFTREGFLKTGDIGYLGEQGELFIVGRQKEMLKHAGRTIAPGEVEAALDDHAALRAVAAVSLELGGLAGEQVLVFAEAARPAALSPTDLHELAVDLAARVHAAPGLHPAASIS